MAIFFSWITKRSAKNNSRSRSEPAMIHEACLIGTQNSAMLPMDALNSLSVQRFLRC
jgi:hypothetical protein